MSWWPFSKKNNVPVSSEQASVPAVVPQAPVPAVPAPAAPEKKSVLAEEGIPTVEQLLEQDKKLDQLSQELGISTKPVKAVKKKSKKKTVKKIAKKPAKKIAKKPAKKVTAKKKK